jgi:hypothetical protein
MGVKPAHWPITGPEIWNALFGTVIVIWLAKQQHRLVSHASSTWNVPIQLGVLVIVPFMKIEKKIKSNQWKKKEKYSFTDLLKTSWLKFS